MTSSYKQPSVAKNPIGQNSDNPYAQFLNDDIENDPSNPYAQFLEEDRKQQAANEFTEDLSRVDDLEQQPEWMVNHLANQPRARSFTDAATDTGRGVMKSLAGVADAAMHTADFVDDAIPLGGLAWEEGDILPSYKTPGEYQAAKEHGMATPTDATGQAMDYWEQGKSAAIKQDAEYLADADGFVDTFKRAAERPRAIGNAIADSIGYMVPGMAAARAAKVAGATGAGVAGAVAGTGAVVEGGAARSQAVGEVMDMPLGQLLERSPDYQALVKSGVDPEAARMRVAADAGFTAQAIAMPVSFLASKLTGAAKAEGDFFTGEGAKDFFTGLFKQAGEEAAQEVGSQFGVNVGIAENADEGRAYADSLGNAAAMGAIMGPAQQAGMKAIDVAGQQLRSIGPVNVQDDGEVDLPKNGEQLGGGIVEELPPEPLQLGHDPQRMIVMPDGTTAWESEVSDLAPSAADQHPGYARLRESPDDIENSLSDDVDIDNELAELMADLDRAETMAREAAPKNEIDGTAFSQDFTQSKPGVFYGGQSQGAARNVQSSDVQSLGGNEEAVRSKQGISEREGMRTLEQQFYGISGGYGESSVSRGDSRQNQSTRGLRAGQRSLGDNENPTEQSNQQPVDRVSKSNPNDQSMGGKNWDSSDTPEQETRSRDVAGGSFDGAIRQEGKALSSSRGNEVNRANSERHRVFRNEGFEESGGWGRGGRIEFKDKEVSLQRRRADAIGNSETKRVDTRLSPRTDVSTGEVLRASIDEYIAAETNTSPTDAQKEQGNYKKAKIKIQGLDIAIENPRGSTRSGTDKDGKPWSVTMHNHYGYIKRTEGADGDHVDVFIGPNPDSDKVFIVDQVNADGTFDEHKVLMAFDSKLKARSGYKSNYSNGWKVGPITSMSMEEFKDWVKNGDTKKPLSKHFEDSLEKVGDQKTTSKMSTDQIREPVKDSLTPEILTESKNKYLGKMARDRGIKKGSPGYADAMKKVEADYEVELDRAQAALPFEEFNRLNSDSPESINRQAWEALRDEYGTGDMRYSLGHDSKRDISSLKSVFKEMGVDALMFEGKHSISLTKIVVPKDKRNMGIGTAAIKELVNYADSVNKRIVLDPSADFGGSKLRLKSFYKRFGFVENAGANRDHEVSEGMYRNPQGGENNRTRYSLGEGAGITVDSARSVIDRIRKAWKNPHIKIEAVENIDGMPEPIKARIVADKVLNEKVKAVYHNGAVYVNASAMVNALDVERAVFHEVHGHYGARALFGKDTSIAMGRLYLAIGGEKGIRDIAKKHNIDLSKYEQILKGESPGKRAEILADELLAHIAQDSKPSIKRWLQELIGSIRTWLRAHGFTSLGNFSDSEVMALLKRTREAATELKLDGGSVLRVLLDVAEPSATAEATQAAYSLSGLPPKTRKVIGNDPVLAAWTLLAQQDEAFQLPVSEKKTLEEIFDEVVPGVKIRRAPEFDDNGAQVWAINPKKDTLALVFQKGKSVWIDVADYSPGQSGSEIYNAVANYAYNTGKTFIGDPAGLSDTAMARRLENMISSALKFGTTDHLWPHERQEQGGAGVPPIKWKSGDDAHNLKEMISASYQSVLNQFPEIADLRYNPVTDQIEGAKDGKVYSRADIEALTEGKRNSPVAGKPQITAGGKTLERAIFTHAVSRGTRQEQFNILARLSNQPSERLAGILYSLAPDTEPETRPSGGFSVSGAMEKMGLGKDNRGASLPPNVRAAYDMLGGKNKTFAEKIKQEVKRQLAPGGLLPREIFDLKIARDAEMNSEDNQQRYILEDFYAQVVEVYHKPYTELRASTRKEIDDYLKGDRTNVKLTDSMVEVLGRMRKHIQNLSAKYMDELLLDAASLEAKGKTAEADEKRRLISTIAENFDTYLHRSYRAFDDPDWPKKVPPEVYQTAVDYLAKQYAGSDPVEESHIREATKKVDLMLHEGTAYDSMAKFIAESKLGSKDLSVLKKRKQISPEIRALLGEYEDPAINYAKSVSKMTRLVSNTGFLRQMRDISLELGYLYEEKDRPLGANKKIAADGSEVYSPLNGLYTFPEFEQALRDAVGSNKEPDWYKWIVTANAAVKYGKTVLAPTTAMRNILSASMFCLTSGHWNVAHLDKSIKTVKTYFTGQDVRGSREYITKLLKLGVLYDAPNYRELQDLIKQVNEGESITAKALRKSKIATALNYAQEFYALGDDFWKILGFENEKAMLIKHHSMSEAQAEKEAAERIRNTYPTYSMTGRGIQMLRRFPLIGSFPSFPAEIIRTTYHKFRYFHQDGKKLGYNNPMVLAKGVGLALGAGMMGAISALSAAMFGVDDDEEDAIRSMLPEWSQNANLLFLGRDENGQVEYMDLTWLDPYSYWKKPLTALARDRDLDEKAGDAAWEALSPFLGVDIAFGAALQFFDDLTNPGVTTEKSWEKLGKSLAPGVINNAAGFWNAADETITKSGKKYTFEDEALALIGFRKGTLNAKVGLTYQAYGYQDKKRAAATVLRDKATDLGKVDLDDLRSAYEQSMEMHKDAWNEMRRIVRLAQKVGMTKQEAVAALRTSGISLRDARLIVADQEFRYQPPKNMMKLAIKRASILFDQETQAELKERAKSLRELQAKYQEKPVR